jgi:hypothetical protein
LAKDIGFDSMFFTRIDFEEKMQLIKKHQQMKVWRPSEENFGAQKDILSLLMTQEQGQYCWPQGFAFDQNYHDHITFDKADAKLYKESMDKMEHLRRVVKTLIDNQDGNEVYMTYGCDFAFTQAEINYFFLDRVIKHWNTIYPDVELIYSNPNKFMQKVKKTNDEFITAAPKNPQSLSQGFALRRDDAFPYS